MPKVSEEYKIAKKHKIVDATIKVLETKALYEVTMLDIIKVAELSKGGIYLYFKDIDDVLIETINQIASSIQPVDFMKVREDSDIIHGLKEAFDRLGDYMESCPAIVGKIRFELKIYISQHPEKLNKFLPSLTLQNSGQQFMESVAVLIDRGIKEGIFQADVATNLVMNNISAYIDGITEQLADLTIYGGQPLPSSINEYFTQFLDSQILYLTGTRLKVD